MKKAFLLGNIFFAIFSFLSVTIAQATLPPLVNGQPLPSLSGMLHEVTPSVVNISAQGDIPVVSNPLSEDKPKTPAEQQQQRAQPRHFQALGSGVIVDAKEGYIITNAHVLHDAKTITVTLKDGRVFPAKVIGLDAPSDVAVLQIKADNLVQAPLGNSSDLKVGDFVAAIGNPFGLNQTVTSGIVSALQRSGLGIEGFEDFIQTDASINPGNSGGALINLKGQVIGINTAILAPGGGNIGIGFAIPIDMARSIMTQLIKYGSVHRGIMGIVVQDFTPALADAFHQTGKTGALVSQVYPYSPAAAAGIKAGDVIQSIDDEIVKNAAQVRNTGGMLRVGSKINLKILREGKEVGVSLVTADPKQYSMVSQQKNLFFSGTELRDFNEVTPGMGHIKGVQITQLSETSMGWRALLRPGDVILSANQTPVANIEQLMKIAEENKKELVLNVMRGSGAAAAFVVLK